jgi:hypothetical protein
VFGLLPLDELVQRHAVGPSANKSVMNKDRETPLPDNAGAELLIGMAAISSAQPHGFATMPEGPASEISTQCTRQISTRLWKEHYTTFLRDSEAA